MNRLRASVLLGLSLVAPGAMHARAQSPSLATVPNVQAAARASLPIIDRYASTEADRAKTLAEALREARKAIDALKHQLVGYDNRTAEINRTGGRSAEGSRRRADMSLSLRERIERMEAEIPMKARVSAEATEVAGDALASQTLLRTVAADEGVAARFAQVVAERSNSRLEELLKSIGASRKSVSVNGARFEPERVLFTIGTLRQCLAAGPLCDGGSYSITR
jgi:hypothetical protein